MLNVKFKMPEPTVLDWSLAANADSYKYSHYLQLPPNTIRQTSYVEARGGMYDSTVFFGPQIFLKEYLCKPMFTCEADINDLEEDFLAHGVPFNKEGFKRIYNKHGGYAPLSIQCVKEGLKVPVGNVLSQVTNTDDELPWTQSFIETEWLRANWFGSNVATKSRRIKEVCLKWLKKTGCVNPEATIGFVLNDFGARGAACREAAGIAGAAHLVNFIGTDNNTGRHYAKRYYGEKIAGYSVIAAEHSTVTSWVAVGLSETDFFRHMIELAKKSPIKLAAVVSDSYDLYDAVDNIWGKKLKQEVIDAGVRIVQRPDSGDVTKVPVDVVEMNTVNYGYTTNQAGYKVLPSCVGVIQGDKVNEHTIDKIFENMADRGLAAENLIFGMGGELVQGHTRDTIGWAQKASGIMVRGDTEWRPQQKMPKTDMKKRSKAGRLALIKENGEFKTILEKDLNGRENYLEEVYRNGELLRDQSYSEIRELSNA